MKYILFGLLFIVATSAFAQFDDPRADLNWYTIETPHFNVVYQEGTHRTAELIAKIAEDVYGPVTSLYHHKPDQKVTFVVKDYADYSNGETNYYTNTIVIWANALDFELRGAHNWLRNVISHEFSHDVEIQTAMKFSRKMPTIALQYLGYENERRQDILSGYPNAVFTLPISGVVMPAWFAEGVAQYQRPETGYESWDSHRDMILRMYALDNDMLTWGEMATFGKTSLGDESSYNQGFSMIRYIGQKYGQDKIRDLSYNLSSLGRMTIDGAIEKTFDKTGTQFYDEWKNFLVTDYARRVADIKKHLVIGDTVENVGFANLFPQFTRDGNKILYISNKTSDYFSGLAFLYDVKAKKDSLIFAPVSGRPLFSPNDSVIVFAKRGPLDTHESTFLDAYTYNTTTHKTERQTEEFRAHAPAFTPDGDHIVYVTNYDGTQNMWIQDALPLRKTTPENNSDGSRLSAGQTAGETAQQSPAVHIPKHQITSFTSGEQIYNPIFTSDSKSIVFDYSLNDNRSIAIIDTDGKNFRMLLSGKFDYRSAALTPDEKKIYYSCDSNGIFNIYSADWDKSAHTINPSSVRQITNVLGGAFYPAVDSAGDVAYSLYTSTGFKLALLKRHVIDSLTAGVDLGQY
ncbi:MAG TPA: biopolymer transporter Tol, partial [Candidatus Kapabacteria bacterium]|nr:biopolymer transporter Tol [Candidatus Kapabacteria bacterium]